MKIHSVHRNQTHEMSIQGSFQTEQDGLTFIRELETSEAETILISFLDARMLPASVILALRKAQQHNENQKVKITVFYRYLASYLSRMDIRHTYAAQNLTNFCELNTIKAVAIGGSAGSLDKIISIVSSLPEASISIFIVQHIVESSMNYLPDLLKEKTSYKIADVVHGMKIEPGTIYVAPPSYHLTVQKGRIELNASERVNYARPSVSKLYASAAREYGRNLVTVTLCGYGADGADTMQILHDQGVTSLVEDPVECEAKDMLNHALMTGLVTYKFPLPELIHYLIRVINPRTPEISHHELHLFLAAIHEKYGYNYQNYESASIKRRIARAMMELCIYNFTQFRELILRDEEMFELLFLEFSINVTEFFREPDIFGFIRSEILPYLASFPHIKIWSAGCSVGMEPVSLAMMLEEADLLSRSQIYASDINPYVIEEAKNGIYHQDILQKADKSYQRISADRDMNRFFELEHGLAHVREPLLNKILYFQHSLLNPGSFHEFQLILCRNVLIYFDKKLQEQVLRLFAQSLDLNGFLVLGKSESFAKQIPGFTLVNKSLNIYQKVL